MDRLDSIRDELTGWPSSPALPNHMGRIWLLGSSRSDSKFLVYALISWDDDAPTDFLVGGYWLCFQGSRLLGRNLVSAERSVEALGDAIGRVLDTFSPNECSNYIKAAGNDPGRSDYVRVRAVSWRGGSFGARCRSIATVGGSCHGGAPLVRCCRPRPGVPRERRLISAS